MRDVTRLLGQIKSGNREAIAELLPLLYKDLRRMAAYYLRRERQGHTLQPTALVHEVYLHLLDQKEVHWQNRSHFFGIAARLMRRTLVDYARGHQAAKRGASLPKVPLDGVLALSKEGAEDLVALDETLTQLAAVDPQQARIVELRAFAGLTVEETAELLGISPATVKRDWSMAKAWLTRELRKDKDGGA